MQNTENKFKHDGLWYIAVEEELCRCCDFKRGKHGCMVQFIDSVPQCTSDKRKDNRSVIFVESDVDKLGDEE